MFLLLDLFALLEFIAPYALIFGAIVLLMIGIAYLVARQPAKESKPKKDKTVKRYNKWMRKILKQKELNEKSNNELSARLGEKILKDYKKLLVDELALKKITEAQYSVLIELL